MSPAGACFTALIIAAAVSPVTAADAAAATRPVGSSLADKVVARWSFDTPGESEGWTIGNALDHLEVADGVLRARITGADAFLVGPPIEVPMDGLALRVRLRGDRNGFVQVYWATRDDPVHSERQALSQTVTSTAGGQGLMPETFSELEFELGTIADLERTLISVRIDTFNHNTDGRVEIDEVTLVHPQTVLETRFAPLALQGIAGRGQPALIAIKHIGGRSPEGAYDLTLHEPTRESRLNLDPRLRAAESITVLNFERPGVHHAHATLRSSQGEVLQELETSVITGQGQAVPLEPVLRSERTRLDFVPSPDGRRFGAARWMVRRGDAWQHAGWLMPLIEVVYQERDGRIIHRQPAMTVDAKDERRVRLVEKIDIDGNWRADVTLSLEEKDGLEFIRVQASLLCTGGGKLLKFSGPVLRACGDGADRPGDWSDPRAEASPTLRRFGLFGGLEFLEPGWASSSERAVGRKFADRWAPHPYKVTVPVMAVETREITAALMWHPLQRWAGDETMPTATFASPNFLDRQENHLMRLSVPTIPRWARENEDLARKPFITARDEPVVLEYVLYAEPDLPVALTAQRWYQLFGTPTAPPLPRDAKATYDMIARNFGETMFWPEENGWRHTWFHLEKESRRHPLFPAELIAHAGISGDAQWVEQHQLQDTNIIELMTPLSLRIRNDGPATSAMSTLRPDGTWPFRNTEQMRRQAREFTDGVHDSLGEDDSTSLGTCVQPLLPLLRHALLSGDAKAAESAVRALKAMRGFRVPRGAQVWEVHQQIPDIRAAALAVEAYRLGYELTGDPTYLDDAAYWAWTGAAFVYSWHVPIEENSGLLIIGHDKTARPNEFLPLADGYLNAQPQVTPYGTVPVLGPTFYVINWFGVLVQWCGLEWAWKVIDLDKVRPDPVLRYIADGVVASGEQQMLDKPPWVGLYPDSWDLRKNYCQPAYLGAMLPLNCLQAQERVPDMTEPWTRVLRRPGLTESWHVSGWGPPARLDPPTGGTRWSATLSFPAGQANELLVVGVDQPASIDLDGKQLGRGEGSWPAARAEPGWWYDPQRRALLVRFTQPDGTARITLNP